MSKRDGGSSVLSQKRSEESIFAKKIYKIDGVSQARKVRLFWESHAYHVYNIVSHEPSTNMDPFRVQVFRFGVFKFQVKIGSAYGAEGVFAPSSALLLLAIRFCTCCYYGLMDALVSLSSTTVSWMS